MTQEFKCLKCNTLLENIWIRSKCKKNSTLRIEGYRYCLKCKKVFRGELDES